MADEQSRPEIALDRVGQVLEDIAGLNSKIWERTVRQWRTVATNVRTQTPYGADAMANDAANAIVTAVDTVDDIWSFWTRMPERQRTAMTLPTVFLLFAYKAQTSGLGGTHALPDQERIALSPAELENLSTVKIRIAGESSDARKLQDEYLKAEKKADGFWIVPIGEVKLSGGTYNGIVYADSGSGAQPLAELRIVVDDVPGSS